jgi:tRNA pseudouridine38-40 synthase
MTVIRLLLAYDGTDFRGWARQAGGVRTVQGVLEDALSRMLPERPRLSVAGRTDAGVHAEGQVASFAAPPGVEPGRMQRMLNGLLAPEVVALDARAAPEGFDARRSATRREYLYRVSTARLPSPFDARFVWHRPGDLNLGWMRRAARDLVGEHDFASFCRAPRLPASTTRDLRRLSVTRQGDRLHIRAEANAFLHQMVRSLVGTLMAVGEGKLDPDAMQAILTARERSAAGPVAPPHGLSLLRVRYGRPGDTAHHPR